MQNEYGDLEVPDAKALGTTLAMTSPREAAGLVGAVLGNGGMPCAVASNATWAVQPIAGQWLDFPDFDEPTSRDALFVTDADTGIATITAANGTIEEIEGVAIHIPGYSSVAAMGYITATVAWRPKTAGTGASTTNASIALQFQVEDVSRDTLVALAFPTSSGALAVVVPQRAVIARGAPVGRIPVAALTDSAGDTSPIAVYAVNTADIDITVTFTGLADGILPSVTVLNGGSAIAARGRALFARYVLAYSASRALRAGARGALGRRS